MDRQTDRRTELRWLRRAIAVPAVARKKCKLEERIFATVQKTDLLLNYQVPNTAFVVSSP